MESQPNDLTADLRERAKRAEYSRQMKLVRRLAQFRRLIRLSRQLAENATDSQLWNTITRATRDDRELRPSVRVMLDTAGLPVAVSRFTAGLSAIHGISSGISPFKATVSGREVHFYFRDGTSDRIPIEIQKFECVGDEGSAAELTLWKNASRPGEARQALFRLLDDLESFAEETDSGEGPAAIPPYIRKKVIIDRIRTRHSAVTINGTIEHNEFAVTTDLRATSDTLWQSLRTFREWILEGGTRVIAEWHDLLFEIRHIAREAKLTPSDPPFREVWHELQQAIELGGSYDKDTPVNWHNIVLIFADRGDICYDLIAGFEETRDGHTGKQRRKWAAEWAEGWMNARERQLCGLPPLSIDGRPSYGYFPDDGGENDAPPSDSNTNDVDLRSGAWFSQSTRDGVNAEMLRKAVKRGTLTNSLGDPHNRRWRHSIDEVCERWPDWKTMILAKAGQTRTKADKGGQSPK